MVNSKVQLVNVCMMKYFTYLLLVKVAFATMKRFMLFMRVILSNATKRSWRVRQVLTTLDGSKLNPMLVVVVVPIAHDL